MSVCMCKNLLESRIVLRMKRMKDPSLHSACSLSTLTFAIARVMKRMMFHSDI